MESVLPNLICSSRVDPLLLEVADVVNTTLDLDTTLRRVAELVRKVIDYEIFAILLLNEKTQELRFRFQVGYPPGVCRPDPDQSRRGCHRTRRADAGRRCWSRMSPRIRDYIAAVPNVRSELAVPLIVKNRVIGVIDIESRAARLLHRRAQAPADADRRRAWRWASRMPGSTRAPRGRRGRCCC